MRRKKLYRKLVYDFPERLYCSESHPEDFLLWIQRLRKKKPLVLELGMGMGDFLLGQAKRHSDDFHLGVEIKPDRIYKAFEKSQNTQQENIAFLRHPIEKLSELKLPEVKTIYIFFPDPWPKKRHLSRRLTAENFLEYYRDILEPKGTLVFKTDDPLLAEFSQQSLKDARWDILEQSADYKTPPEDQTGYEKKFLTLGKPIFYLVARPPLS